MIRYLLLLSLLVSIFTDCAFKVKDNLEPYKPEGDDVKPQPITKVMCTDDWGDGRLGCCNDNAFRQTENSFKKIDTVFGSGTSGGSGGCDLCAINLKRFWCQYACDPNQTNFVRVRHPPFRLGTGLTFLRSTTRERWFTCRKCF